MSTIRSVFSLLKNTVVEWWQDHAPRSAAALSFYAMLSLAPLVLIVITVVGLVVGRNEAQSVIQEQVRNTVGSRGADVIAQVIVGAGQSKAGAISSLVGFVVLLFGASGVFGQLQVALNTMWEVRPKPGQGVKGILRKRLVSFAAVLGIGFMLLVSMVSSAAINLLSHKFDQWIGMPAWSVQFLNLLVSLAVITVLMAFLYKVLPDAVIRWSDVWVGAFVTALLFTAGQFLIGLYLGFSSTSSAYGAFGSLVALLIWVYYSAQIVFLGAEFTQVYANRFGERIKPEEYAESTAA